MPMSWWMSLKHLNSWKTVEMIIWVCTDIDRYLCACIETLLENRKIKKALILYWQSISEEKKVVRQPYNPLKKINPTLFLSVTLLKPLCLHKCNRFK